MSAYRMIAQYEGFFSGDSVKNEGGSYLFSGTTISPTGFADEADELPMHLLDQAYKALKENYYWFSTIDKNILVEGMVRGMMESLKDKHSEYFDPIETQEFNQTIQGNFEWIGAYVGKTQSGVLVRQIFDNSPAKDSWILPWDIISLVDGQSVLSLELEDAVKKIRGPAGTSVELNFFRPSENWKSYTKKVVRRNVKIPSVVSKILPEKIGVITVGIFWETTPIEFLQAYTNLSASGAKWIIVDLRDNPGGLLDSATSLLQNFIPEWKLLVETKSNNSELRQKYFSEWPGISSMPIVVLVNENSASASEIFAGAIQDYARGVVIGSKTFGKWSVQITYPLQNSGELKITVARWYTPNGRGIDGIWIVPDIETKIEELDYEKQFDRAIDVGIQTMKKLMTDSKVPDLIKK